MFRGNAPARIDDKGRLKIPNMFRAFLETKYGRELFVTSTTGEFVRVYPKKKASFDCNKKNLVTLKLDLITG